MYGRKDGLQTSYGRKTAEGIADLIERETGCKALAEALADAVQAMVAWSKAHPDAGGVFGLLTQARAALAAAGVVA